MRMSTTRLRCMTFFALWNIVLVNGLSTILPTKSDELQSIAFNSARKVPFSLSYMRTWRLWSETSIQLIRSDLAATLTGTVDYIALKQLSFSLGVAADAGIMPSFEHEGARAAYAVDYFCRAQLAADLMFGSKKQPAFLESAVQDFFGGDRPVCRLTSLGGGPGFDFVAAALIAMYKSQQRNLPSSTQIHATVLDYELGWGPLVGAMSDSVKSVTGGSHHCDFGFCDITVSLNDPVNHQTAAQLKDTDVWICSYCVAENATKLRDGNYVFFRELFAEAREGSLFIFTETTHRLWPEIALVAQDGGTGFDLAFPRREEGRGKKGRQMVLQKRMGATLGEAEKELIKEFVLTRTMHERKVRNGHVRQPPKIRGAK